MTLPLFEPEPYERPLADGAVVLGGFALPFERPVAEAIRAIAAAAPFRHMTTPGGRRMSVAMTNCGSAGWVSDEHGYRYSARDPATDRPWPAMPEALLSLARGAAGRAGFDAYVPDACLINRYEPGARLSLHQDRDEQDLAAPIVSVSLGLPAVFLFGGLRRADTPRRIPLTHGDIVVWGGPSRLAYHGVLPLDAGHHPVFGPCRINLTFRKTR